MGARLSAELRKLEGHRAKVPRRTVRAHWIWSEQPEWGVGRKHVCCGRKTLYRHQLARPARGEQAVGGFLAFVSRRSASSWLERSGRLFQFGQKDFQRAQRGEQLLARDRIRAEGQRSDQETALPQVQFPLKHCRGETPGNLAGIAFQSPGNIISHSRPELIQRGQIRELSWNS